VPVMSLVDVVVKVGGSLLARREFFDAALAAVGSAASERRVLVVPGGGPFADTVRDVDRRCGLGDTTAHWMAVLAMEQYAHLLAEQFTTGALVTGPLSIANALAERRIPVLAPFRWLRETDALPHSWAVTSDSIAAWVAGEVGAPRLVLIKPPAGDRAVSPSATIGAGHFEHVEGNSLVDGYFAHALREGVVPRVVHVDQDAMLAASLRS
jgi:5-(aminomethyl)-3-furanmethanol phosphate kinase